MITSPPLRVIVATPMSGATSGANGSGAASMTRAGAGCCPDRGAVSPAFVKDELAPRKKTKAKREQQGRDEVLFHMSGPNKRCLGLMTPSASEDVETLGR